MGQTDCWVTPAQGQHIVISTLVTVILSPLRLIQTIFMVLLIFHIVPYSLVNLLKQTAVTGPAIIGHCPKIVMHRVMTTCHWWHQDAMSLVTVCCHMSCHAIIAPQPCGPIVSESVLVTPSQCWYSGTDIVMYITMYQVSVSVVKTQRAPDNGPH